MHSPPKMNVAPPQIMNRIGHTVELVRKHLGLNQRDIAPRVGLDQSAFSRVESGKQVLTHPQWLAFCELTGVSPDATASGWFELKSLESAPSAMKLPDRYAFEKHIRVRALLPLIDYAKSALGQRGWDTFLEGVRMNPDYFACLNASINFNFAVDVVEELRVKRGLKAEDAFDFTRTVIEPHAHGSLRHLYDHFSGDPAALLYAVVRKFASYRDDFIPEIIDAGSKTVEISLVPSDSFSRFQADMNEGLGAWLGNLEMGYFANFCAYGGRHPIQAKLEKNHFAGDAKTIIQLRLSVASGARLALAA